MEPIQTDDIPEPITREHALQQLLGAINKAGNTMADLAFYFEVWSHYEANNEFGDWAGYVPSSHKSVTEWLHSRAETADGICNDIFDLTDEVKGAAEGW
jgi:hypothetical protein